MITKKFTWIEKNGMHARPAGKITSEASKYESEITISTSESSANAKSIFSMMGLKLKEGSKFNLNINGKDEKVAKENISKLLISELAKETTE